MIEKLTTWQRLKRDFRLLIISYLIRAIGCLLPKDCIKTQKWLMIQPWED